MALAKETFVEDFRQYIKEKNQFLNQLGIKRVVLKPYTQTTYPPDEYSQKILDIGDFRKAFLYRARRADMNVVVILGPQGRGKTNIYKIAIELGKELGASFAWSRNLYIGEQTIIHRKYLVSRHEAGEQVINDEAEFLNRPNSVQLRDLIWTLSSGRDSGLHFWFSFPTTKDTQFSIWDAHGNWLFYVFYRDQEKRKIKYKLYFKVTFEHPFTPPEWVEYPHPGARFHQSFLLQKVFDEYKRIKDTIYDIDREEDWYREKKILEREIRAKADKKIKKELIVAVEEILDSPLTIDEKVIALDKINYPKYLIAERLHKTPRKINIILEDELFKEGKKGLGDIFISTKRETIEKEIEENMDPNHEDFWSVSNYPTKIIKGKSRLYLTVGQEKVASFIIEGVGERKWRGRLKKVLLLKKESVRKESGIIDKKPAPMGGYSYI